MRAIQQIAPRPVFLIHGREDFLIPAINLQMLFDSAGEPKQKWLGPGPHSNIMTTDFYEYQKRVIRFFDNVHGVPEKKARAINTGGTRAEP